MKVNEIISESRLSEGPMWDKLKQVGTAAKGAVAGYQQAKATRTASAPVQAAIKKTIQDWATQSQMSTQAGTQPTAAQFAQFMKIRTPSIAPPTPAEFADPAAYITKAVTQHFINYANKVTAPPAAAGTGATTPTTPGGATAPASTAAPVPGAPGGGVANKVTLIHTEPDIINYDKRDYVQNDQGMWTPTNSNRPVIQAMQAFFTKQATALTGGQSPQPAPAAPAAPAQQTPAQIRAAKQAAAGAVAQRQMARGTP